MSKELKTVVIDAGHGGQGKVGGSSGNNAVGANGLLEKDLTLDIARRTVTVLKDSANVVMTRNADVNLSLAERADIARRNLASIFLSLHFNGFSDKSVDGTEVFIGTKAGDGSEQLAGDVLENLARVTRTQKRGVKRADLGVLAPGRHLPATSACLAEIAFLSNPAQAKNLEDAGYRQQIALALGDAVLKNLRGLSSSPQSVPFEYGDDELDERHYQSLDAQPLSGNPIFDIKGPVSKTSTNGDDILAVKKRLIQLGFDWLTADKKMDTATVDAIKLFQTIIAGKNAISGDGKIDVGKETHKWLQAINAPRWQTMPAGSQAEGFFNYELSDTKDTHDFGTSWIADTIKSAAAHYRDNYLKTHSSAALLTVNDVSLPRGGNTPDHDGHEAGLACDLQLPRTDGKAGGINLTVPAQKALYDRDAARAVLNALRAQPLMSSIFFNDDVLIGEGLCARLAGHDHHIHFQITPPARGAIETDGLGYYHRGGMLYQGSYLDDIDYQTHSLDAACTNADGIKRDQAFLEFAPMGTKSNRANPKENLFLRWCDIPKGKCGVDVVVHFHGWNITRENHFFDYVVERSGLDLLKPDKTLTRKRPTLCILPFGIHTNTYGDCSKSVGECRRQYEFPFFISDDGLQKVIDFSLEYLRKRYNVTLSVDRLILTAHSGGGVPLEDILGRSVKGSLKLKKSSKEIDEVHLFDSTYEKKQGNTIAWANKKIEADAKAKLSSADMPTKGGALRVIYPPVYESCSRNGTAAGSEAIETGIRANIAANPGLASWYRVDPTRITHDWIPKTFGFQLLEAANAPLVDAYGSAHINKCCAGTPEKCEAPKATTKSLGLDYEEPDYFAEREASYTNY